MKTILIDFFILIILKNIKTIEKTVKAIIFFKRLTILYWKFIYIVKYFAHFIEDLFIILIFQ